MGQRAQASAQWQTLPDDLFDGAGFGAEARSGQVAEVEEVESSRLGYKPRYGISRVNHG